MKDRGDASPHRPFLFPLRHHLGLKLRRGEGFLHALDLAESEAVHHSLGALLFLLLRFFATHGLFHRLVVIIVVTLVEQHKHDVVFGI